MSSSTHTTPGDRCMFLELPRELRDEIYRLALTSSRDATIFYRSTIKFDRKTPPATAGSEKPSFTASPKGSTKVPFNALQYVNHQLRQETKGLHFSHNTLAFTDSHPARINSVRAAELLSQCSDSILREIRRVEIVERFPPPCRGISRVEREKLDGKGWFYGFFMLAPAMEIRSACKRYPKMEVTMRLHKMNLDQFDEFEEAAFVLGILSGKWNELPVDIGPRMADEIRTVAAWYRERRLKPFIGDEPLALDNFRFFPAVNARLGIFNPDLTSLVSRMTQWHESGF